MILSSAMLLLRKYAVPLLWGALGVVGIVMGMWLSSWVGSRSHIAQDISQVEVAEAYQDISAVGVEIAHNTPEVVTIALLGKGGAGHEGGHLTDIVQLLHIDTIKQQVALISIPRDIWIINSSTGVGAKINALFAHRSGGYAGMKHALQYITGLPVEYVIGVDFVGFKRLVGIELKGIEVEVPQTFEDAWYPITGREQDPCGYTPEEIAQLTATLSGFTLEKQFACRYERIYFPQGTQVMHGGEALAYVRSRHSSSDFARSARQHAVMIGMKNRIMSLQAIKDIPTLYDIFSKHVETDLDRNSAIRLGPAVLHAHNYSVKSIVLSTDNVLRNSTGLAGQFILIPKEESNNWQEVHRYIAQQLGE